MRAAAAAAHAMVNIDVIHDHDTENGRKSSRLKRRYSLDNPKEIHALVTSAAEVGEATYIMPIVSTLSFGFAVAEILAQNHNYLEKKTGPVLCCLGLSASLSLYTTTFSVLEY